MRMIICVLALFILMSGTGVGAASVVVQHWHNAWAGDNVLAYLNEMKAAFEKANPDVKVDITTVAGNQYANKWVTAYAAGVGPDLVEWWPGPTTAGVVSGMFENLFPYLQRDNIKQTDFVPAALEAFIWGDTLWGLPNSGYPLISIYNKAMWDNAGLVDPYDQGRNWTWQSVINSGQKLVRKSVNGKPDVYAVQAKFDSLSRTEVWAYQAGNGFFDRPVNPTKSQFTSEGVITAMSWLRELVERGLISPDYPTETELAKNEVAVMFQNGPQSVNGATYMPSPGRLAVPIGFAPMPMGPKDNGSVFITDGWMMSAAAKNKSAAWRWMKFIAADAAHSVRFAQYTGRIPGMVRALPSYLEALPKEVLHPTVVAEVTVAPTTRTGHVQHAKVEDINTIFVEHMENVRLGAESVRSALEQIQAKATVLLGGK